MLESGQDETVDVAILTGEGKAFYVGADLKTYIPKWEHANLLEIRKNAATGIGAGLTRGQHRLAKPAIGGGFELALVATDKRS